MKLGMSTFMSFFSSKMKTNTVRCFSLELSEKTENEKFVLKMCCIVSGQENVECEQNETNAAEKK